MVKGCRAMIELREDELVFSFPEVHEEAVFRIGFQRTLRIPDDGHEYPLPAGLGSFPVRHVDDFQRTVPAAWLAHGGVMLPMHQAEAMWLNFSAGRYPFAVKVAAGKVNAVSGKPWSNALNSGPASRGPARSGRRIPAGQDYLVIPDQPWLDGFNVGEGSIRQFVAMPLGDGYTAEEQLTGRAEHGGLQLLAYPMKAAAYAELPPETVYDGAPPMMACGAAAMPEMGLGLGGLMHQEIAADGYGVDVWDLNHPARCFVHLANADVWTSITGAQSPTSPPTPRQYRAAGIPWFDYTLVGPRVPGAENLAALGSVAELVAAERGELADNESIPVDRVIPVNRQGRRSTVREYE